MTQPLIAAAMGVSLSTVNKAAILYMERKPEIVKSITSFPYILKSL